MMGNNLDQVDKFLSLKISLQDEKGLEEFYIPESELFPVVSDDRFKHGLQAILDHGLGECSWGSAYTPPATSREEYMQRATDIEYFRGIVAYCHGYNPNFISFENKGGILNKGVCWWHSRFQRSSFYLSLCLPNETKEDEDSAKKKIRKLMKANEVVELHGFDSFFDFTKEYESEIQSRLNRTQIIEGIFMFGWINGLYGLPEVSPDIMKKNMDKIYREVSTEGVAYVKLQTPGIDSHSWIITEMEKQEADGYRYKFIDSNHLYNPMCWSYNYGDTYIDFFGHSMGVPYLQRSWELKRIKQAISEYIKNQSI